MTDPVSPRLPAQYGTCGSCRQLKHVRPDGRMRIHNRFAATGTTVTQLRCSGSGAPSLEAQAAEPTDAPRRTA